MRAFSRTQRFLKLRPTLSWSLAFLSIALISLFTIAWSEGEDIEDFADLEKFQMVELSIRHAQPEREIIASEAVPVVEQQEKPLFFGEDLGDFEDLTSLATPPRPKFSSLPEYPASMRHEGVEGVVIIELGIDEFGTVLYGRIVESLGKKFDHAVVQWARNIRFYPALSPEGESFRCRIRLPIRFRLDS